MATYVPPPGYRVSLRFKGAYTPPLGYRVALQFGDSDTPPGEVSYVSPRGIASLSMGAVVVDFWQKRIGPVGIAPPGFGSHQVINYRRYVLPAGAVMTAWGRPVLRNATLQALPLGIPPGAVGAHRVFNFDRYVEPQGIAGFRGFGTHWVSHGLRRITAGAGLQVRWGTATLSGGVRTLDLAGRGIASARYGASTVWFRVRELFPSWFIATRYGIGYVGQHHGVSTAGWDSAFIGQAEVHVPRLIVDLNGLGIAGPAWGVTVVSNFIQHIRPRGWMGAGQDEIDRFGRPEAYNLTTIVRQLFEVTPSDGGVFGRFTDVANKNKVVRTEGRSMAAYGTAVVRNNARVVRTMPQQDYTLWGNTLVAPRVRPIYPQGTDTSQWGSRVGTIVYNDARVLRPAGWLSLAFGHPGPVWSNLQTAKPIGFTAVQFGQPMVAFAVRTVAQYRFPDPPPFGLTKVEFLHREVAPDGIGPVGLGVPDLFQRFNRVFPMPVLPPVNQMGTNWVRNLTPEVRTMGAVATLWGQAHVRNQWERYQVSGFDAQIFGRHVVRDRRFTVVPPGIAPLPIPQRHQVRNVMPDPPSPQTIGAAGAVMSRVGQPALRSNSIYPTGFVATRYGAPQAELYGILPVSILPPYNESGTQFGTPGLNRTQWVKPEGLEPPVPSLADVGPRYIWAPRGYPYDTGYWNEKGHIMDFYTVLSVNGQPTQSRPVFGLASVTHYHRTVLPSGRDTSALGRPSLALNPQYVRHEGSRFVRFGFPKLNAGGTAEAAGFVMTLWGRPVVIEADYRPRTLRPGGILGTAFGRAEVQLFHRELHPRGWDSFTISPPRPPAWPRTSHWVSNAYPPFPAEGTDMARYGTAWVSHRVRTLAPLGFDAAVVALSTPGQFALRMRVTRNGRVTGAGAGMGAVFGTAELTQRVRYLWPRPIYAPGWPRPAVRPVTTVAPAGWDSLVLGNIDRWEAGKVKPHGDDLATYGRAIIHRALHPAGFAGTMGLPRIGAGIGPAGFDHSGTGKPATIARWCGNKAMAVHGAHVGSIGTPHIAQVTP